MTRTRSTYSRAAAVTLAVALSAPFAWQPRAVHAEANEVRFADQIGLLYLPLQVVAGQKLVEKHAKAAGLGDVKVSMHRFSGGGAVNTALLSGSVDLAAGGIPPLLKIWDRTRGSETEVRGMIGLTHMAYKLFTIDPKVKSLKDYDGIADHKIALPSVKVSTQAVTLEMAAEKTFGEGQAYKLDPLTVSMPHPQALAAMLSGGQVIKSHFATLPYSYTLTKSGKARLVFSSYDLVGPHTGVVMYNTKKWKEENPKLFNAVAEAFFEAHDWIAKHPDEAAKFFIEYNKTSNAPDEIKEMITDKSEIEYRPDIHGTYVYAQFLHKIGDLKNMPASWKDYFWDPVYRFKGD